MFAANTTGGAVCNALRTSYADYVLLTKGMPTTSAPADITPLLSCVN